MLDARVRRVRPAAVLRAVASPPEPAGRAPFERLRRAALAMLEAEALPEPAYAYRFAPIDRIEGGALDAGGQRLHVAWLMPECGRLTALACCVATLGDRIEGRIRSLFTERRASTALALDALANELLFALSRFAQDEMHSAAARRGLTMAGELRAGDPGLALEAQDAVLALADAPAIGVQLSAGQVMHPLKSTSMVLGVGLDLPPARWSRCDPCPNRPKCRIAARTVASGQSRPDDALA